MADKITQEDLNAVRGFLRVVQAVQKFEPIIQKIVVAEEQANAADTRRREILVTVQEMMAEMEHIRQKHQAELRDMESEKSRKSEQLKAQFEAERVEASNGLDKEIEALAQEGMKRRAELANLDARLAADKRRHDELIAANQRLEETHEKHKRAIAKLLQQLAGQADKEVGAMIRDLKAVEGA